MPYLNEELDEIFPSFLFYGESVAKQRIISCIHFFFEIKMHL